MVQTVSPNRKLLDDIRIFKLAVENSFDHFIITDVDGKIVYANKAAENMTGYSLSEMKGKTPKHWGGLMDKDFYRNLWRSIKVEKNIFMVR